MTLHAFVQTVTNYNFNITLHATVAMYTLYMYQHMFWFEFYDPVQFYIHLIVWWNQTYGNEE